MAVGKLIQVATETVSSAVATVEFDQITTNDVYVIYMNNVQCAQNNIDMRIQVKNGATTLTPYDRASKDLRSDSAFNNNVVAGGTRIDINAASGNATNVTHQGIFYLYNFQDANEYSYIQWETQYITYTNVLIGQQGGGMIKQDSLADTILFYWEGANNFQTGSQFTLYKVV